MATASTARNVASQYLNNDIAGSLASLNFVGMTDCPEGHRLGYEVKIDQGFSTTGAILGALLFGLFGSLVGVLLFMMLSLFGVPPALSGIVGFAAVVWGLYRGWKSGGSASEVDRVTVTVSDSGDVVMVNKSLSSDEFDRAIGREYDRQSSQFDSAVAQVSKHWLLHKVADKFLGSNDRD